MTRHFSPPRRQTHWPPTPLIDFDLPESLQREFSLVIDEQLKRLEQGGRVPVPDGDGQFDD